MKLVELLIKYNLDSTNDKFFLIFPDGYAVSQDTNIEICAFYFDTFSHGSMKDIYIQSNYFSIEICEKIKNDLIEHIEEVRLFNSLKAT